MPGGPATGRAHFAHLHLHSQYSILDGAIPIGGLMERLRAEGMTHAAVTDHGNLFGAVEFHEKAVKAGLKPIIGCEVYVAQGSRFDRDPETGGFNGINHLILLAMNETGYRNLVRLVSKGYLEGFYYKPRVDLELLQQHNEGLIATSGCLSGQIPGAILGGRTQQAWELVESFARLFQDRYYLELQRHGIPEQELVNAELLRMHADLGLPLIATNDCHYLNGGDAHAHEALLCVQTGKTLDDPRRFRFNGEGFYVKTPAEMLEVFHDRPDAVSNTVALAERCDFTLETGRLQLPEFQVPPGETFDSYLTRLAERGLRERLSGDPDAPLLAGSEAYSARLQYELDVIRGCGYSGYFLIVWDFIRFARERDIPVGPGRGSSAGSLVAWVLKITGIDPLEHRIPFERFLNPERVSMPDIDVDFCMNRRGEVIRYLEEKYNGEGDEGRRVAGIVTFGTMQAKAALRDVGRVLGLPFGDVDRVAKLVPNTLGIALDDAHQHSRELRELVASDPRYGEVWELARKLEGQIRHPGKHAAGVVISSEPLLETAPLYRDARTHEIVTQFDYRCAEKVGLLKFDLLGLRTLTIVRDAERRIAASGKPGFSIEDAPLDDPETYQLLCRGDTEGVFQVGQSTGMTDLVVKFQPRQFTDLIPLVALYRPGPLQSGMVEDFVQRRHGRTKVEYLIPELEEILAETFGVIVYQDQVLQIANRLASFSLGEGDLLRRAMGKKIASEMEAQRARFLRGCRKNGHPDDKSQEIFNLMYQFAGYGFPKAHAAAYGLLAHQTAYLKAHHPAEFFAAVMTAEWRDHDRLERYVRDAAARSVVLQGPSVNESEAEFSVTHQESNGGSIRFGLAAIKNVGGGAVDAVVAAREADGPFASLFDFCARVDSRRVNRRVVESLVRAGAFDFVKATRASLWDAIPRAFERGAQLAADREAGQQSLFGDMHEAVEPQLRELAEWEPAERLRGEKELLGFYVTGHPLTEHADTLDRFTDARTDGLGEALRGRRVRMAGMLNALQTQKTRRGGLMAKASLEDLKGALDVVIFPQVFEAHAQILRCEEPLAVCGTLQLESERPELHIDEVVQLDQAWSVWTQRLELHVDVSAATRECLEELRAILDLVPGDVPVSLAVGLPNRTDAVFDLPRHRVAVNQELVRKLDLLLGRGATRCALKEL